MKKTASASILVAVILVLLVFPVRPVFSQTWNELLVTTNLTGLNYIACSADGMKLIIGSAGASSQGQTGPGNVFLSKDAGLTWTIVASIPSTNYYDSVASSADGSTLAATADGFGIYTSTDSGNTWAIRIGTGYRVVASADGTHMVACDNQFQYNPTGLKYSINSGADWSTPIVIPAATDLFNAVVTSADGMTLVASGGVYPGGRAVMYQSGDGGASWTPLPTIPPAELGWTLLASSADGSGLLASAGSSIYTSHDYGGSWTKAAGLPANAFWETGASSANGMRFVIGADVPIQMYSSYDGGTTWISNNAPTLPNGQPVGWSSIACSSDGVKIFAIPQAVGNGIASAQLADIDVTLSATPAHVDLQDQIQVTLTITNETTNTITNVQVNGAIGMTGNGGVSLVDISGPAIIASLPPRTNATITYEYEATNDGLVTFSATVKGQELGHTIYSLPGLSGKVAIFPKCDLMAKANAVSGAGFQGAGEYQQAPSGDQNLRVSVGAAGAASYTVRVQNNSSIAHTFVLTGTTNSAWPAWNIQVTYDSANILDALAAPGGGWTTPSLDPDAYVDLQVSLAPMAGAELSGTQSVRFDARPDASDDFILDSVLVRAQYVSVPVQVAIQALNQEGLTPDSISAGQSDADAPLVPVTDPNVLAGQPVIDGGLVADGVTPLLVQVTADASALQQFPQGAQISFQPTLVGPGTLNGDAITERFQVLQNGAWQAATASTTVTLTSSDNVVYFQLLPINSDDVQLNGESAQLGVDFSVVDTDANQDGDLQFNIRKPPIALIHGYNTRGDWGSDFMAILGTSRPFTTDDADNFVVTVKYGQDTVAQSPLGTPVYDNTVASLDTCAQMALQKFQEKMALLHTGWAFTRFDVVAHSQGGVLTRMLCSMNVNDYVDQPYRNSDNFFRGRFHRIVTIGSPHNGTRLLRYLLDLEREELLNKQVTQLSLSTVPEIVGLAGVVSTTAQAKFDPWGPQFAEVNDPSPGAPWQPDPAALFHLVRVTIDNGASPAFGDLTPAYLALDLSTATGGQTVIPRGSDGVVDYDSMAANVPPAGVGANVFTVDAGNDISHAAPQWVFNSSTYETASTVVAQHVIDALDQSSDVPPGTIVFSSFSVPPLLSTTIRDGIDNYAISFVAQAIGAPTSLPSPMDDQTNYQYGVTFPTNLPAASSVVWSVQVYGPDGITSDGVELSPSGVNNSQVTVTVDGALVGDVVLSGIYMSGTNTLVGISPVLVASLPLPGPAMTGFQVLPGNIALSVGAVISPLFQAQYSDGSTSLRYVTANQVEVTSSQPAVVSVTNALNWQLSSIGTSIVTVNWNGFKAQDQVTVFDPNSTTSPALSLVDSASGQLTVSWPGFTTSYQLESVADLAATNDWQSVSVTPVMAGGQSYVTLPDTNSQQFYRLRLQ